MYALKRRLQCMGDRRPVGQGCTGINLHCLFFVAIGFLLVKAEMSGSNWGIDVTPEECSQGGHRWLDRVLSGEAEPYAFTGPPKDCQADGCKHLYWGPRCRFIHPDTPSCPKETKEGLLKMLREYARKGAKWAQDALSLRPCEMWGAIKGRTLWFAGDSVTQETAHTFICFLLEYFETAREAEPVSGDERMVHRLSYNANNAKLTTWCAQFKENTRICMLRANFAPRMANVLLPAMAELATPEDIVVMNYGLWSNDMLELDMHTQVFESTFRFYQGRLPNKTFWRETSAQHYSTMTGMYDRDKPIIDQRCQPIYPGVNLTIGTEGIIVPTSEWPKQWSPEEWEANIVMAGGYRNKATQPAVDRLGLHTIRTWNTSLALWDYHHHTHMPSEPQACAKVDCDCTHSCSPSWSQIWLPNFRQAFSDREVEMKGGKQPWEEPPASPSDT